MKCKFRLGKKGRMIEDPRRAFVKVEWKGRTLLGEVVSFYRSETRGVTHLRVKHFNGEPWPIEPGLTAVDVIRQN